MQPVIMYHLCMCVYWQTCPISLKYLNHTSVWKNNSKLLDCLPICPESLQKYGKLPTCLLTTSLPTLTCRSMITMFRRVAKSPPQITTWRKPTSASAKVSPSSMIRALTFLPLSLIQRFILSAGCNMFIVPSNTNSNEQLNLCQHQERH